MAALSLMSPTCQAPVPRTTPFSIAPSRQKVKPRKPDFQGSFHGLLVRISRGHDEIEFFPGDFGISGTRPVNQRLHLGGHGVEIHGRSHHDHICPYHLIQDFRHVVPLRTGFSLLKAGAASRAIVDVLVPKKIFWAWWPASWAPCKTHRTAGRSTAPAVLDENTRMFLSTRALLRRLASFVLTSETPYR